MLSPALLSVSCLPVSLGTHVCSGTRDQDRLGVGGWTVGVSASVSLNSADDRRRVMGVACTWSVWRKRYIWLWICPAKTLLCFPGGMDPIQATCLNTLSASGNNLLDFPEMTFGLNLVTPAASVAAILVQMERFIH